MSSKLTKRTLQLIAVVILIVAGYGAWHVWGIGGAPQGQPPLAEISHQNYGEFRAAFNAAASEPRIIALLSPT